MDIALRGFIEEIKRLPNSINGNPQFEVCFKSWDEVETRFKTKADSAIGYAIEGIAGKNRMVQLVLEKVNQHASAIVDIVPV